MKYLSSNKVLYIFLQCTWGILMNIIGGLVILILICIGKKPHIFHNCVYVVLPGNWGGLELGTFFIVSERASSRTYLHESGHALQNIIWGPLFLFVIGIPSAIRYWYRELRHITIPSYDSIWFEGQATYFGFLCYSE